LIELRKQSSPGAQETDPAITSIVRDLCRQPVFTRVDFEIGGYEGSGLPKPYEMDAPNVAVRCSEL
jgi:hypothetical protein